MSSFASLLDAPRNQVSPLTKAQFQKLPLANQRIIIILEQIAWAHGLGYSGTGKDRGINQLAERIGINNATLQTYLRATSDPLRMRPNIFNKIADARKISASTLRALIEGRDESEESEEEIISKFFEYCSRIPIDRVPQGIILLAQRIQGQEISGFINNGHIEEEEMHEGNLRLWELVEEKWASVEEAIGYEPEQMPEEEFIEIADRVMKGEAKAIFDQLRNGSKPISNKYLTGVLSKFLGKPSAELFRIRDGESSSVTS